MDSFIQQVDTADSQQLRQTAINDLRDRPDGKNRQSAAWRQRTAPVADPRGTIDCPKHRKIHQALALSEKNSAFLKIFLIFSHQECIYKYFDRFSSDCVRL